MARRPEVGPTDHRKAVKAGYLFQDIAKKGRMQGIRPDGSKESREWFRREATAFRKNKIDANVLMANDPSRLQNRMGVSGIGHMHLFYYDPKTKEDLPYYDSNPLVFPIEMYKDGFLGINLHYLPPLARAKLLNALWENLSNEAHDSTTKVKVSYQILKGASQYRYFKPCVKRYLTAHVRSRYLRIPIEQWDYAIMLPTERFVKQNKSFVWAESMRRI